MTEPVASPRRYVKQLGDGETIDEVFLVVEKQMRANRNGNLYLQLELRDRTGTINARLWNAGEALFRAFEEGDFVVARGKVQLFQGALQIILSHVDRIPSNKVELGDFLPHTEQDVSKLYERLRLLLMKATNPHLRALAECFLMDQDFVRAFSRAPAGIRNHHAYIGGLLEHVELTYERSFGYSDEGQLVGHLVQGVEILNERVRQVPDLTDEPFPPELLLRLKHMILSHHGTYEFGSPKLPMTPEAIALHHLDNLDAKVHSFTRDIREDANKLSAWTPYNQALQRKLFKGGAGDDDGASPDEGEGD
jgi:3'-5' exoribonuclease